MAQLYRHANTSVSLINYHFVWCPVRRRKIIKGPVEKRLLQLISETCKVIDCEILAVETMPDHVRLFVNTLPTIAASQIIGRIKGYSSKVLRDEFPDLMKMPSLWTRSYFVSTAGNVSSATIKRYVENQKTR